MGFLGFLGFLFVVTLIGLVPASIARSKGRSFGAWWFYGSALFIVALPHSLLLKPVEGHGSRKCPYCAELVKEEAKVCRYCGKDLPPLASSPAERAAAVHKKCERCGKMAPLAEKSCTACGQDFARSFGRRYSWDR